MRPSKFNEEEMKQAIAQVKAGTPLVAVCRKLGITQTTFYRWRTKYGQGGKTNGQEARALRDENHKLKQLVADLYLERQLLRESLARHTKAVRQALD